MSSAVEQTGLISENAEDCGSNPRQAACSEDEEEVLDSFQRSTEQMSGIDETYLSSTELERVKQECRTNKHVKPPYSYIALITMAVLQVGYSRCTSHSVLHIQSNAEI